MAQAVRKNNNTFAIVVTIAVVVAIVVVAGVVIWMNNAAAGPGETPQSSTIDSETGAISVGDGPNTLDTYVDFICPACKQFEQTYGDAIQEQVEAGTLTLNIHPISILDRASQGTEYSSRAAGAMYCVADAEPEAALPFLQAMYAGQPAENTPGLTDEQIVQIARDAGVTDADAVEACITEGTFKRFAQSMTEQTPLQPGQNGIATPTIVLNGETIANSTLTGDPQADIVDKLE
jgi:protein-disulfide isomerase